MLHRFHHFHPLVTFVYYLGAITLLMMMSHPVFLINALLIILMINYVQDRFESLRQWLILIMTSGFFILVLNPIFNERGHVVLIELGNHRVTLEAVIYGGITALSIVSVITLFVSYNEVMTPNKVLFLFSKFMPQFAVLLMLTLRFIPLMRRRLDEISAVQQSKDLFVTEGKWKKRAENGLLYLQVLLTYSLEEAIQTADSMKARGYGQGRRSTYDYFRFKRTDRICLFFLIILLMCSFLGRFFEYGHLVIYPVMESSTIFGVEWFFFAAFVLFLAFPLIVEGGGYLKWRLSN